MKNNTSVAVFFVRLIWLHITFMYFIITVISMYNIGICRVESYCILSENKALLVKVFYLLMIHHLFSFSSAQVSLFVHSSAFFLHSHLLIIYTIVECDIAFVISWLLLLFWNCFQLAVRYKILDISHQLLTSVIKASVFGVWVLSL